MGRTERIRRKLKKENNQEHHGTVDTSSESIELQRWVKKHGLMWPNRQKMSLYNFGNSAGRGFFSKHSYSIGDCLLILPGSILISREKVIRMRPSIYGKFCDDENLTLIMFILIECRLVKENFDQIHESWKNY